MTPEVIQKHAKARSRRGRVHLHPQVQAIEEIIVSKLKPNSYEAGERRARRFTIANCGTLSRIEEQLDDVEIARLHGLIDRAIRYGWNAAVRASESRNA